MTLRKRAAVSHPRICAAVQPLQAAEPKFDVTNPTAVEF
jgi:hypothetical protein